MPSTIPLNARFRQLITQHLPAHVQLRESSLKGRGLYYNGEKCATGTELIRPIPPLAHYSPGRGVISSGKEKYDALIAQLVVQKAIEEIKGEEPPRVAIILAHLAFPQLPPAQTQSAEEQRRVEEGISEVKRLVGASTSEFELVDLDREEFLRYWGVLYLNAIRGPSDGSLSLFSHISMINHACAPSVGLRFEPNGAAAVVALRELSEGEELTIDYVEQGAIDNVWTAAQRQRYLKHNYGITCTFGKDCACKKPAVLFGIKME